MKLDLAAIRSLIPHSGAMCLLESVEDWDDETIYCQTSTHRSLDNPLRRDGRLSTLHAFEYGAQAAAVHGGLRARRAGGAAPFCYLAALRGAKLHRERLDDLPPFLFVSARRLFGAGGDTVYEVEIRSETILVAEGRVTIMQRRDEPT